MSELMIELDELVGGFCKFIKFVSVFGESIIEFDDLVDGFSKYSEVTAIG